MKLKARGRYVLIALRLGVMVHGLLVRAEGEALVDRKVALEVLRTQCYECHGGRRTQGGVDLKELDEAPSVSSQFDLWQRVAGVVERGEMPPDTRDPLESTEKANLLAWLRPALDEAVQANAGDPGPVTLRRLTHAEFTYSLRDLTGIEFTMARDFVRDGGGGEGFSNIGDVLYLSPQQLDQYIGAARTVVEHATVLPGSGIVFHEQRVGLRSEVQVKDQAEQALYVWYQKAASPFIPRDKANLRESDYMLACWKYHHREITGAHSLEQLADTNSLFLPFLNNWYTFLTSTEPGSRFLDLTRLPWRALPPPDPAKPGEVPEGVQKGVISLENDRRAWIDPTRGWANVQRMQQDADGLNSYSVKVPLKNNTQAFLVVSDIGDDNRGDIVRMDKITLMVGGKEMPYVGWLRKNIRLAETPPSEQEGTEIVQEHSRVSDEQMALMQGILERIGEESARNGDGAHFMVQAPEIIVFPVPSDATEIRMRGKLDLSHPDADHASVQWALFAQEPPAPTTILPGVLTVWKRQTARHRSVMGDFNQMKMVFPDIFDRRLEQVARNYQRGGKGIGVYYLNDHQLSALLPVSEQERFSQMLEDWRLVHRTAPSEKIAQEWDASMIAHGLAFAERAFRRPLIAEEKEDFTSLYHASRAQELDRESSVREMLVRVLISPQFLFKLEDASQPGEHPVSDLELASRLSYFLWASIPDDELRFSAAQGHLREPAELARQVSRMLRHPRAAGLAHEFAGQWVQFHGFDSSTSVDTEKFPEFTEEIRRDMHQEALLFFTHLIREDRPVSEVLLADYTFLNERLARFYGVPNVTSKDMIKVSVGEWQRGGVLGMGGLLTRTSYPHRTSPVLRGNWLLHAILGTPTPPPPPDVPILDESTVTATSLRQRLEQHRADRACASCHDKIDPLGFALEAFDPIGRLRTHDELGRPVDTSARAVDGTEFSGLLGLKSHLSERMDEFHRAFSRKLLGYALGRAILPTDYPLIEDIATQLAQPDGRFSSAVLAIAQSRQFNHRRNE